MSEKMICVGCDAYTSSVLRAFEEGHPCPSCDLPATASLEILAARKRGADQKLIDRLAELSQALLVAERRALKAEQRLDNIKYALEETV